jgi:hypothetical protein
MRAPTPSAAFVQSRAQVLANRALLVQTRHLITMSRRALNPAFGLSGAATPPDRQSVRTLLARGDLFPIKGEARSGRGRGKPCAVCGDPIVASEVEYVIWGGVNGTVVSHAPCFVVWKKESAGAESFD